MGVIGTYLVDGVLHRAGKRVWTEDEDRRMRELFPNMPTAELARLLQRTTESVNGRADKLGLHKSQAYLESPAACRLRRGDNVGKAFRYPKGHVPANKGVRRPGWSAGRMKDTQFKKGHGGRNPGGRYMPIGSTRLVDGYVYRKVSEIPNVPWTKNWRQDHHLIWEAAYGPVPKRHNVGFKNRDRTDIRLDNLELISRVEHMRRNTVHNLPQPIAKAIQLIGALNRQIRKRERGEAQHRRSA